VSDEPHEGDGDGSPDGDRDGPEPSSVGPGEERVDAGAEADLEPAPTADPSRLRRVAERLVTASATERFLLSFAALALSVAVGTVLILGAGRATSCDAATLTLPPRRLGANLLPVLGLDPIRTNLGFGVGFCYNPVTVFDRLFIGALGDPLTPGWDPLNFQMAVTLQQTTVLLFTGLSVAIAFRAGIFNIGTQGQLVVGGLATALSVFALQGPVVGAVGEGVVATLVLVPTGLVVGALFGAGFGAIPGALKAYAEANEVITTIMLNFVASSVAFFLVSSYFRNPDSQAVETTPLGDPATFPPLVFQPRDDFSVLALVLGLVLAGGLYYVLEYTPFGYDLRTSGLQPEAAEYGGVDAERTIVASMAVSGALAGVGGAVYVLMVIGKFQTGVPAFGFDGITVSILAGNNPLGVGFAAFLFGTLKSGSTVVGLSTDVPPQLVGVLRGLIILFVAMPEFFRLLARRAVLPGGREETGGPVATDGGDPDE
jgi:simple sugar transport system permease protein